jgi:hypothetical protein
MNLKYGPNMYNSIKYYLYMNIINTKNIYNNKYLFRIHTCRRCLTPPPETTLVAVIFFIESGDIFYLFKTIFIIVSLPPLESIIHSPPLECRNMFLMACTCSERRMGSIVVADEENGSL